MIGFALYALSGVCAVAAMWIDSGTASALALASAFLLFGALITAAYKDIHG